MLHSCLLCWSPGIIGSSVWWSRGLITRAVTRIVAVPGVVMITPTEPAPMVALGTARGAAGQGVSMSRLVLLLLCYSQICATRLLLGRCGDYTKVQKRKQRGDVMSRMPFSTRPAASVPDSHHQSRRRHDLILHFSRDNPDTVFGSLASFCSHHISLVHSLHWYRNDAFPHSKS